jgi:AcrR family transcriptional regulator
MAMTKIEPRKVPRQQRARFTVDAILEASAHILETAGSDALTTNAIAERAGVSIGSLYQYFPTREAIMVELIRRERAKLRSAIAAAVASDKAAALDAAIRQIIDAALAHQFERPALARALDVLEPVLPIDAETQALNAALISDVAGLLATHAIPNSETAAFDLVAMIKGLVDAAGRSGETDASTLAHRCERAALGYLARS